ncbi:GNAT family N-acetyltransferase [Alteribacter lacisalsi]|uniref:GNAT family N-acetyltransferase n=1 Tax=Alteribacter lacisalsi TaxID=2045244 RepID=A0A2W0HBV7_9BACI|nr:GNAT family protein [Alteribacter lacisalsi]PYZ97490.1 GNAT family N-acetyltransferase [Alteribacter lacisalsi]
MNRKQVFFSNLPELETDRLHLRPFRPRDAEDVFTYASIPELTRFLPWDTHRSLSDSEGFLNYVVNWFPEHRRAELGFVLSKKYWGQGLVPEAARRVIAYGFDHLDLVKIKAPAMTENVQSRKVLEKLGFELEGVLKQEYIIKGKSRDMAMYALMKGQE